MLRYKLLCDGNFYDSGAMFTERGQYSMILGFQIPNLTVNKSNILLCLFRALLEYYCASDVEVF